LLDAPAGTAELLLQYRDLFSNWKKKKKELEDLRAEESRIRAEQDFLQFQFDELETVRIRPNESQLLEEEFEVLSHAEDIKVHLASAIQGLDDENRGVIPALRQVQNSIQQAAKYSPAIGNIRSAFNLH